MRRRVQVPEGQAWVLLVAGDENPVAEVITSLHPITEPLEVPAARIAEQAGMPINELPGRKFAVAKLTENDADGFRLLNDPRL